jgi:hypothetical protein
MELAGAGVKDIADWGRQNIRGIYKPGYELLLKKLGTVDWASYIGQLALASPIDLECNETHREKIFVEDALPIYRLARLSIAAHRLDVFSKPQLEEALNRFGLADTLLSMAGMPSVAATFAPIVQKEIDPLFPLRPIVKGPATKSRTESGLYDYRRYAFSMIEKFKFGHRHALHQYLPAGRLAEIFLRQDVSDEVFLSNLSGFQQAITDRITPFQVEPDLTFFGDRVNFNGRRAKSRAYSFGDNMLHLLFSEACSSLVKPARRMRRPDDLIAMFVDRLAFAKDGSDYGDSPLGDALKQQQTLELSEEWERLRRLWPSTEVSVARFWTYLRDELGGVGERSLKARLYDQPLFN